MSIKWTDEALYGAWRLLPNNHLIRLADMRAALDAAAKAQGLLDTISHAIDQGRILGRAEAFEEAARKAEEFLDSEWIAAAIRDLAEG